MNVLTEAKSQGFRDPPDNITLSCFGYMGRITELRGFIGFFFGLIESSQAIANGLDPESKKIFEEQANSYKLKPYSFSVHRQFVNEVMLSRHVETFDLYLISILREIFLQKPEMLKSEGSLDVSTVIELKNFDDLVAHIAEKKLHDLSYKPLSELATYIKSRTGIEIFPSEEIFETVLVASEIRNLIAHNDCRINDRFLSRTNKTMHVKIESSDTGKVIISDEWLRRACYQLDGVVFDFDEAAAKKFGLKAPNRFGLFGFRG